MNLEKLKFFDVKTVKKMASYHLRIFKHRVEVQALDKDGNAFPPYKEPYKSQKARGMTKLSGGRYKSHANQPIKNTNVSKPTLVLTGRTMMGARGMKKFDEQKDGYRLGWSGEREKIIKGNAARGRDILGAPSGEMEKVVRELGNLTEKQMKQIIKNVTVRVE